MSVKIPLYTLLKQIGIFLVVSFLVFRGTFVESNSLGLNLSTGVSLLLSIILWGIINLHTCWLIPGYLFQRRYKKYIIYLSSLVGFMLAAMVTGICLLGQYYVMPEQLQKLNNDLPFFLFLNALALILYFFAFSFTIFLHRWVSYQQRLNELENMNIQTELNRLKDQLQPEFFSRMLNKVRTLLKEDGEKASLLIFKLSRLLRYQLYESERQKVLLGDDICFMTDYMKLEKICNPELNFEIRILNEVRYIQIPPLLFMPVIEYVIQTTVCGENGKGENIRIDFQMEENQLRFTCTYYHLQRNGIQQVVPVFDKLQRRLDLLYPGSYQLKNCYTDEALCAIDLMLKL